MQESFKRLYRELFVGYTALGAHGNEMVNLFNGENLLEKLTKGEKDEDLDFMIDVSIRSKLRLKLEMDKIFRIE